MLSKVEQYYLEKSKKELVYDPVEKLSIIQVASFPELGKLTAQRFIEWVQENPGGVVSLPTGKTPEHFIKWVAYYIKNWEKDSVKEDLGALGIDTSKKPDLFSLHFVQIDEFYPIDSFQHNSFYYYIQKFYFNNWGLDPKKALFINVNQIPTAENLPLNEIFPEKEVDLSLRTRWASNRQERLQKQTIDLVDQFCTDYERKIRELGGIGFFLGGIGPDGHIGFNVQGSDHFSTTRLIATNYETQAAAAGDLGGIEIARKRLVITIGLDTITHNPNATAIIIAAGDAKANIVRDSIENPKTNKYPATVLQTLKNARFYLTNGAALRLMERRYVDVKNEEEISQASVERAIINLMLERNKELLELTEEDYNSNKFGKLVLEKTGKSAAEINKEIQEAILARFNKGLENVEGEVILHTAPHHDDIMLGYLPYINHLVRSPKNTHYFVTMTSGFTAVTNSYMLELCQELREQMDSTEFKNRYTTQYFDPKFVEGRNRDINLFLDGVAAHSRTMRKEATARRLLRNIIEIYDEDNIVYLKDRVDELINYFRTQYPGKKDIPHVQKLKGMLREFEEEILWGHFGFYSDSVRHMRLGFYQGDIFTENPEIDRDVIPIYNLLKEIKPTVVTVALDPEGSGPDTHYKVLQAVSAALKMYQEKDGAHDIKVWGYRNVWYRFHPAEANIYVPVSINSFSILDDTFMYSYGSQKAASFPSWEYDGPFCRLAQKIQVDQYQTIKKALGKDFFLKNNSPRIRAAHGMIYLKELTLEEFYSRSTELRKLTENI
jgi:glucosamine-6-phosphate deaminase